MLALCDIITPNESEAEALTGLPVTSVAEAERAADALLARGVVAVVVTLVPMARFTATRPARCMCR